MKLETSNTKKYTCYVVLLSLILVGCFSNKHIKEKIPNVSEISDTKRKEIRYPKPEPYIIGLGDIIQVQVFRRSDMRQILPFNDFTVQPDGEIFVPFAGNITAEGMKVDELKDKIYINLSKTIFEPLVYVKILDSAGNKLFVIGEVYKPGIYPAGVKTTALEAILMAGGFKDMADRSIIVLIRTRSRKHGESSSSDALSLNIQKYLEEAAFDQNVILKKGDIVYVPSTYISKSDQFWKYVANVVRPFADIFGIVATINILENTSSSK